MPENDPLITTAQPFYAALQAHNTRDWWQENRATYDDQIKPAAGALLDEIAPQLASLTGEAIRPKLFRPHRDVRFSKDKRPYNTHLHMMWTVAAEGRQDPAFFFGIDISEVFVGIGIMEFEKSVLDDWRKLVDLDAARVGGIIAAAEVQGFRLWEPVLKRVPPPYTADHPMERLLRMKGLVATRPLDRLGPLPDRLMAAYADAMPVMEFLLSLV
ncbi:MAG: TIGR02453 family protein [Limimaricola sp.]|uniref:TIGR02453 family protein n=1 Tax=Limimaricola sp. TaxID=2211665 RepID=UPI001DDEBB7C|nr:TIGR02453 family protein [Limimaricola sp.]MBI1416381.1 TIGR02453 family protein [Limimaricola sp.]